MWRLWILGERVMPEGAFPNGINHPSVIEETLKDLLGNCTKVTIERKFKSIEYDELNRLVRWRLLGRAERICL
jgi:hypothetical protein